jgi:hypothetical protein
MLSRRHDTNGETVPSPSASIPRDRLASAAMRIRLATLVTTLLMGTFGLGLAACGSPSAFAADSTCHASGEVVCIGQSDSNRSVNVRLGETVEVTLSETSLMWSDLRQVGPSLFRVTHKVTRSVRQLKETYQAIAVGHTVLQATGAPRCKVSQACPQFLLLWRVPIVVTA